MKMFWAIKRVIWQMGFDPRKFIDSFRGLPYYVRDLLRYRKLLESSEHGIRITHYYPIMHERFKQAGESSGHYFYQDLWAARKVFKAAPGRHVDIGSSVSGFISHLLTFMEVEVVDVRPLRSDITGLKFIQSDATNLKEFPDGSLGSISSLHAGEHFGLGRYGDPVDPEAHFKFMRALTRVLRPGGRLYFSVPCGKEALYFNAHLVLSPNTILGAFSGLKLVSFSCVTDDGKFHENCPVDVVEGQAFGCGLFEFSK